MVGNSSLRIAAAAVAGSRSGLRAVGVISAALLVVNLVEALIPGFLPGWMRARMAGIAALLTVIVVRVALAADRGAGKPVTARK